MQAFFRQRQIASWSVSLDGTSQTDRSTMSLVNRVRYM